MIDFDQTVLRFSFGADVADPAHRTVLAETGFDPQTGFGWLPGNRTTRNVVRPIEDMLRRSFVLGRAAATLRLQLAPGNYRCDFVLGDGKGVARSTDIALSGGPATIGGVTTQKTGLAHVTAGAAVPQQGVLDVTFSPAASAPENGWVVNRLTVTRVAALPNLSVRVGEPYTDRWNLPPETGRGPRAMMQDWRGQVARMRRPAATGLTARGYLDPIEKGVDAFLPCQNAEGAVIDPYKGVEFQYATPCFAYAAALIAARRGRADLTGPALAAFHHAARALGTRTAADGHEDFYPAPLAHAHRLLAPLAAAAGLTADLAEAAAPLAGFDPRRTYRKPPGGIKRSGSNWNCKALAGHQMLIRAGLRPGDDGDYVSVSLLMQGLLFNNEYGLYAEGPATYDVFPRAWLADMLAWGYEGPGAGILTEALDRGALTGLFMQSPTGELAAGGRSSHHQWSDALQCVTFEWAAGRALAAGDPVLAGVFVRAARRAMRAVLPWQRPQGDFWVVKNQADPAQRHGFESYSSQSQYNLLALTALGFACELAETSGTAGLPEQWTPAERGAFLLRVDDGIDKTFACMRGTQIEIARVPTPLQTPRGVIRIHMAGLPSQLPMTDGLPDSPMFELPGPLLPGGIALGLAWPAPGGQAADLDGRPITSLAGLLRGARTEVSAETRTADGLRLVVTHHLEGEGPSLIEERIDLQDGRVDIDWRWPGWTGPVLLRWPLFAGDGATAAAVSVTPATARIVFGGAEAVFTLRGARPLRVSTAPQAFRNGWFRIAEAGASGDGVGLRIAGRLQKIKR